MLVNLNFGDNKGFEWTMALAEKHLTDIQQANKKKQDAFRTIQQANKKTLDTFSKAETLINDTLQKMPSEEHDKKSRLLGLLGVIAVAVGKILPATGYTQNAAKEREKIPKYHHKPAGD